jgi:hypothetical protein
VATWARQVSEEERQREAMQAQAKNNALGWREKGNAAFKAGDFAAAERLYSSGLRHLPSAVLFANRAQVGLPAARSSSSSVRSQVAWCLWTRRGPASVSASG